VITAIIMEQLVSVPGRNTMRKSATAQGWCSLETQGCAKAIDAAAHLHHGRIGARAEALDLLEREQAVSGGLCEHE